MKKGMSKGDRVLCLNSYCGNNSIKGKIGTIISNIYSEDSSAGVVFDMNIDGHSLGGSNCERCEYGYGWWIRLDLLYKVGDDNNV